MVIKNNPSVCCADSSLYTREPSPPGRLCFCKYYAFCSNQGTDPVGPHPRRNKKYSPQKGNCIFGWGGGIRTHEMQESKSCALPLGDAPILNYSKNAHSFYTMGVRLLYGVEGGIRTHGLQSHNLTR